MERKPFRGMASWLIIMVIFYLIYAFFFSGLGKTKEMAYSDMVNAIKHEEVTSLYIDDRNAEIKMKDDTRYKVVLPSLETLQSDCGDEINKQMQDGVLTQNAKAKGIPWSSVINIGLSVVIVVLFIFMFRKGGNGPAGGFTRNPARITMRSRQSLRT